MRARLTLGCRTAWRKAHPSTASIAGRSHPPAAARRAPRSSFRIRREELAHALRPQPGFVRTTVATRSVEQELEQAFRARSQPAEPACVDDDHGQQVIELEDRRAAPHTLGLHAHLEERGRSPRHRDQVETAGDVPADDDRRHSLLRGPATELRLDHGPIRAGGRGVDVADPLQGRLDVLPHEPGVAGCRQPAEQGQPEPGAIARGRRHRSLRRNRFCGRARHDVSDRVAGGEVPRSCSATRM